MASSQASIFQLLKQSGSEFIEDECPRMAAALSYYTIFSLPALLVLILLIVGFFVDPQDVRGAIEAQIVSVAGPGAGEQVRTIIEQSQQPDAGRPLALILGLGALLFGATGAFIELQAALNRAWGVKPDPDAGGVKNFILKRALSFGMILSVAFLLLVSLVLSAALAALGDTLAGYAPGVLSGPILQIFNLTISLAVITLLFGAIFKILPDASIAWKDVWVGAAATALLFVLGKFLIGLYLGQSNPGEAYGAAGAVILLLVWVYYSAMILFFGAEFTQAWAESRGGGIEPEEGAVRIDEPAPEADPSRA